MNKKTTSSRENVLSKPHASMLHAFCTCNYIRLPLTRQHKTSVFVRRFAPSRRFFELSDKFYNSPFAPNIISDFPMFIMEKVV